MRGEIFSRFLIFAQQYRRTKARFSLGMVLFAGAFLLKETLSIIQALDRAAGSPVIGARIALFIALGEAAALGILLYNVAQE